MLGMRADGTSYRDAADLVFSWASASESRYVCVSNVHMTMETYDSLDYRVVVNGADLVTPDGMPVVWALRLLGVRTASQVRGPTLTRYLMQRAAEQGVPVGFLGGTSEVLARLAAVCREQFPRLDLAYSYAPPFRPLTDAEDQQVVDDIARSGARVVFVGLGCPKQEKWMASHRGRIPAVMLGVGAAFDFIAGVKPEAPRWMQRFGLEWVYRLASEPRRLWRRYAYHNPRFVALVLGQYLAPGPHG